MAPKNAVPTHRAVLPIKFSKNERYRAGDLLTLTDKQVEALGPAVEPYSVPVSELTSDQLAAAAAEAKKREKVEADANKQGGDAN